MQMCCLCDRDQHITVAVRIHAVLAEQVSVCETKKLQIFSEKFNKLVTRRGLRTSGAMRHLLIVQHLMLTCSFK